jgi:hypothetical protein
MQLLQAPRHSLQHVSSPQYIPDWRSIELSAQDGPEETASRHDAQMLTARAVPVDPYTAWLEEREADRRSSVLLQDASHGQAWFSS